MNQRRPNGVRALRALLALVLVLGMAPSLVFAADSAGAPAEPDAELLAAAEPEADLEAAEAEAATEHEAVAETEAEAAPEPDPESATEAEEAESSEPEQAEEAAGQKCGDNLEWSVDDYGTLTISGEGAMWDFSDEFPVPWADQAASITSLVIGEGVTSIGHKAFANMPALASATISASVSYIEAEAFAGCGSLMDVVLEGENVDVVEGAFDGTPYQAAINEAEAEAEAEAAEVEQQAAERNEAEEDVDPEVEDATSEAEASEPAAAEPEAATEEKAEPTAKEPVKGSASADDDLELTAQATSGKCGDNLTWTFKDGTLTISGTGDMYNFDKYASFDLPWKDYIGSIKSLVIESGVTSIGNEAFYGLYNLSSASVSDTVSQINSHAFYGCKSLTSLSLPSVTRVSFGVFYDCRALTSLSLPSATHIGSYAFGDCIALTSLSLPSVTDLGGCAFYRCHSLASLSLPSVIYVGSEAFYDCRALTSLSLPSATHVDDEAFEDCTALTSLSLPSVVFIGRDAFLNCDSLVEYNLGNSLSEFDFGWFIWCDSLRYLHIPDSVAIVRLGSGSGYASGCVFSESSSLEDVYLDHLYEGRGECYAVPGTQAWNVLVEAGFEPIDSTGMDISGADVTLGYTSTTYTGAAKKPAVTVELNGGRLSAGDYSVVYRNNVNSGTATVTVMGAISGSVTKTFTIKPASIAGATIGLSTGSYTYTGTARKPGVTVTCNGRKLVAGTDYSVSYSNNVNAGTATVKVTGKGNYVGSISKTFTIKPASIAGATEALSATSYTYNGAAKKPSVTVKLGDKALVSGSDYDVSYASGRTNAGTYKVTVTGKGNYTGTISKSFTIKPASIAGATVRLSATSYTYSGTAKKPSVTATMPLGGSTVTLASKATASNSKVKIAYASGRTGVGAYKVTVTGTGNYAGTVTKTFKINPKGTSIAKLTPGIKCMTVKWGRQATQTSGYQVRYSRSSGMSNSKTLTVSGTSTVSKKLTGLYKGKRYYVQVRTYKTVNGVKYYSAWSAKKYATTK